MSEKFNIHGDAYALVDCCSCGVRYLIPATLDRMAQENRGPQGRSLHCPNGHSWYYTGETEAEKYRRERDKLQQQIARVEDEKREALAEAEKSAKALTRHKKRAAAGTCPCCKRTFTNMALHIKHKHPDFAKPNVVALKGGAA